MGKTNLEKELAMRIDRYLNYNSPDPTAFTVAGEQLAEDLQTFCRAAEEDVFEECIASLYEDDRYRRHHRLLARRWRILDWLFGEWHMRLYQHTFMEGSDEASRRRRHYRHYLNRGILYRHRRGAPRTISASGYNQQQLEALLSDQQYHDLQLLKHGPQYRPEPDDYEEVIYREPPPLAPSVPAPPPAVAEYLLRAIRGTEFEITQ